MMGAGFFSSQSKKAKQQQQQQTAAVVASAPPSSAEPPQQEEEPLSVAATAGFESTVTLLTPNAPSPVTSYQRRKMSKNLIQADFATRLNWLAGLDIDVEPHTIRKTSIICTIGPKTKSVEQIVALRKAGMNIVRMNFSHGSHEYHGSVVDAVHESFKVFPGRPVAIALDTKGPEIRTGLNKDDAEITLAAGQALTITTDDAWNKSSDATTVYVDYKNLPKVVKPESLIYIDDGLISLRVLEVDGDKVKTTVLNSAKLGSRKGVNLPNTIVDLPAISEKDREDLLFGVEKGVDMIFASFIRKASDVLSIREVLGEKGKDIKIISKIENHEGVRNFSDILKVTDGVMVARGDLGIEIPPEKVFIAQKMMIAQCNMAGKPVICATQMLESMTTNPRPTRAEVSDVANAVLDNADCVMLSGETAKGLYPIEAVAMMDRVCREAESCIFYSPLYNELRAVSKHPLLNAEALACAAVNASHEGDVSAIVVLTTTGETARLVAKYRPEVPIITVTRVGSTARQAHLSRGCYPLIYPEELVVANKEGANWQDDVDRRIRWAMETARDMGLLTSGATVVAIQGWRGGVGNTNTLRMIQVP